MSAKAIAPASTDAFELSRNGRQVWWWGIYIFGSVVLPFAWAAWMKGVTFFSFWTILMLPMGLNYDFSFLCEDLLDHLGFAPVEYAGANIWLFLGMPVSYLLFIINYRLTSEAKTRHVFLLLLLSLTLLVCASLIGWVKEPSPING